jgi:hypothetical protein
VLVAIITTIAVSHSGGSYLYDQFLRSDNVMGHLLSSVCGDSGNGIVDHSCLNFLFVPFSTYKETPHIEEKKPREHPFNTCDCLIEVTSWAGLTVCFYSYIDLS